ncbi:MAG: hypothetical protein WCX97_01930 [Candidatus Magasanikbacteria bacterium]
MTDDQEIKDNDQKEKPVTPPQISSKNPDKIKIETNSTNNDSDNNLTINSVEGKGVNKLDDNSIEINIKTPEGEEGEEEDKKTNISNEPPTLKPEEQPQAGIDMKKPNFTASQTFPRPQTINPGSPGAEELTPLVSDETLDQPPAEANTSAPPEKTEKTAKDEDVSPPADSNPNQDDPQTIAAELDQQRQQQRLEESKQAEAELQELSKDSDDMINSPAVTMVIKTLLPKLADEITDVFTELKQIKGQNRAPAIQKAITKLQELKNKINRLIFWAGMAEGLKLWLIHFSWTNIFIIFFSPLLLFYFIYGLAFGKLKIAFKKIISGIDNAIKKLEPKIEREALRDRIISRI